MLVTPDFVLINMPMTGATVVAEMLRAVYGELAVEVGRRHAVCAEIPEAARGKPLLSVSRSPFERYVLQYHYGCWRKEPGKYCEPAAIIREYPQYPNVTFAQFVRIANRHYLDPPDGSGPDAQSPGWHTEQYLRFYTRDPASAYARIRASATHADVLKALELPVHFVGPDPDSLSRELRDYLSRFDIAEEALARLDGFVASSQQGAHELRLHRDLGKYYDRDLIAYVHERERWLFERFPFRAVVAA